DVGDVPQAGIEVEPGAEGSVPVGEGLVIGGELVIRTIGSPYGVLPAVKSAVFAVLPDVPLRNVMTMEELVGRRVAQRRLNMLLLGLFGVLGLVISVVGIYGLMAWAVSQRTREIGVRMALGATRSNMIAMVLLNEGALVASGLIAGGIGVWFLSVVSRASLFNVYTSDS